MRVVTPRCSESELIETPQKLFSFKKRHPILFIDNLKIDLVCTSNSSDQSISLPPSHIESMPTYITVEPTVIDDELLRKAVAEEETAATTRKTNQSDNEIPMESFARSSIHPSEVTTLRLDYKSN